MSDDRDAANDDKVLRALARVDGVVRARFSNLEQARSDAGDLPLLLCLLDDLYQLTAVMRTNRDIIRTKMDGATLGLTASQAYGQVGRLGQKR